MPRLRLQDGTYIDCSWAGVFEGEKFLKERQKALLSKKKELEAIEKALEKTNSSQSTVEEIGETNEEMRSKSQQGSTEKGLTRPKDGSKKKKKDDGLTYTWTKEQDELLRQLKLDDNTWRAISVALEDRPIAEIKKRWDVIAAGKGQKQSAKESNAKQHGKKCECCKGLKKNTDCEAGYTDSRADGNEKKRVSFEDTEAELRERLENIISKEDKMSLDETLLLHRLSDRYEDEKWRKVSARFYDLTGKRINPDKAKLRVMETKIKM